MTTENITNRRRMAVSIALGILAVVAVLLISAWFGGRGYLARSVVQYEGTQEVVGLASPVEITFDAMGIPQVWAKTDNDMYFALGWLHASERLFQMELVRRMSAGTLSEVFGDIAYETDVYQRQIGFQHLGERIQGGLDEPARAMLEAYTAGINNCIERTTMLPPEFVVLGFEPRRWTVLDLVVIHGFQTWYNSSLMDGNAVTNALIRRFGDDLGAALAALKPWSPPTVPEGFLQNLFEQEAFPLRMTNASNTWVVAAERSASGAALHASDPHLAINEAPGFWYIAGLHSEEGTEILGITVPGMPVVAMGHNGMISWAFTVAPLDMVDYFEETLHPDDSTRVLTPSGYQPMDIRIETIQVKGEDVPRRLPVYQTPRGVLVEHTRTTGRSLHWAGFDLLSADGINAGYQFNRARDFETFRTAVLQVQPISVNFSYADRAGNIGYQMSARVPRRTYNPLVSQQATDTTARWEGYYDADYSPYAYNPEQGWLASTNNQPAPPDWPVPLPGFYNLHRIERAKALLSEEIIFSRSDMERIQEDAVSALAVTWKDLAADGAEQLGKADLALRLRAWKGRMALDDTLAGVFAMWWRALPRHLFEDELGADWPSGSPLRETVLVEQRTAFIDDRRTPEQETAVNISALALEEALEKAAGRPLGAMQALTIVHPLAQAPVLDRWLKLNRGPFPRGGDSGTLDATWSFYNKDTDMLEVKVGPSMRFVMDWADPDAFTIQIPFGQSGNPFSPHYDDFLDLNQRGERWVVPFSKENVYQQRASLLRLRSSQSGF